MSYNFINTTKVFFCDEVGKAAKQFCDENNYHKILFVTGGKHSKNITETIVKSFDKTCVEIIDGIVSNPLAEKIALETSKTKMFKPDVIISVGGGSVHDSAKALSVMYFNEKDELQDYTVTGKLSVPGIKKVLPIITVPTLSGAGAEVSPAALIRIANEKKVIFSPLLHPIASFIDVKYAYDIPDDIFIRSAFDALIQSLEGYLSNFANNLSDAFALQSIKYFVENLNNFEIAKRDKNVCEKIAIASFLSSYVCSVAGVGAIHALSDPLSGYFDIHHATALAMVAIPVLRKNLPLKKEKLVALAQLFKNDYACANENEALEFVLDNVSLIISKYKIDQHFNKIDSSIIDKLAEDSFNPDMNGNPYEFTKEEIKIIFEGIL